MKKLFAVMLFVIAGIALGNRSPEANQKLTVHEWGTFTSVAGIDGKALPWASFQGPGDLPCFVENMGRGQVKFFPAMVRMETPVLYFYSPVPVTLSVGVGFPRGLITEWFPKATTIVPEKANFPQPGGGRIEWKQVDVVPGATDVKLPGSNGASHYYAARNTDAAPVRIGEQWEKMIFYRGVGNFTTPLRAVFQQNGSLTVRNESELAVPLIIWFENKGGRISYQLSRELKNSMELPPLAVAGSLDRLLPELAGYLTEFGLYRKEAEAMVETWRDSWFEAGSRLFYILPSARVNELLPLSVTPEPSSVSRVFVGRTELPAPWIREAVRAGQTRQFGRFASPFFYEMQRTGELAKTARFLGHVGSWATCVQ